MKSILIYLLASASLALAQTKTVGPQGQGIGTGDRSAFLNALGGTTAGKALFQMANPSAITFPRINADNTVSALSAADFRTAIGAVATTGNETISGNKTFSGQAEFTGQLATNGTSAMTRDLSDARYGRAVVMKLATTQDITAGTLTDISGTDVSLEASSDYEINGFLGVETTGGSPTNRVQFRFSYSGTLASNQGFINTMNSSGATFAMVNGAFLTTALADTSNVDRSYPVLGAVRTSTAGTMRLQAYRITGAGTTPKLLGGSFLIFRKIN